MRKDSGMGAFLVIVAMSIILVLPILLNLMVASGRETGRARGKLLYSEEAAQSGLADALTWFRRQTVQPVANPLPDPHDAFAPTESTGTVACCTLDASVGLVGEYLISPSKNIWARYEIRRQGPTSQNPVDPLAAHDISDQWFPGHSAGEGLVWSLTSTGYSFTKADPLKRFDEAPNKVLNQARFDLDIGYVALNLPAPSALIAPDISQIVLDPRWTISGGPGAAISIVTGAAPDLTAFPVSGNPEFQVLPMVLTLESIFGMDALHLRRMANEVVDPRATVLTVDTYGGISQAIRLTFIRKNPSIANGYFSLNGKGVIVIDSDANVTMTGIILARGTEWIGINTGNLARNQGIYTGVIVHNGAGDLILSNGLAINGAIVVTGTGRVRWASHMTAFVGNGGGVALTYSNEAIDQGRMGVGYKPRGIPLRGGGRR